MADTTNNNITTTSTTTKVNESKKAHGKNVMSTQSSMATNPVLLQSYMRTFNTVHSREFKWMPLPGYTNVHMSILSARSLADSLKVIRPTRQPITYHVNFETFYIDRAEDVFSTHENSTVVESDSSQSANDKKSPRHKYEVNEHHKRCDVDTYNNNENKGSPNTANINNSNNNEHYVARVPVKKISRILQSFAPNIDMY